MRIEEGPGLNETAPVAAQRQAALLLMRLRATRGHMCPNRTRRRPT